MYTPRTASWLALACLAFGASPQDAADAERAALETAFAAKMSGATLLGHFVVDGGPETLPQPEAYRLGKVEKLEEGDDWRFESTIEYGEKSYTLPIVVEVKWAGDTPVITLTDMPVPLMGTFTARVVVYGERYAGIWDGGDHGGEMFGRVVAAGSGKDAGDAEGDGE